MVTRRLTQKPFHYALTAIAMCAVLAGCGGGGGTTAPGNGSGASGSGSSGGTSTPGITWTGNKGQVLSNGTTEFQLVLNVQGLTTGQSFVIDADVTGAQTISLSGTVTANGTYTVPGVFYTGVSSGTAPSPNYLSVSVTTQPADGQQCQVIAQTQSEQGMPGTYLAGEQNAGGTITLPVLCSEYPAATPVADEQLVPFPGTTAKVITTPQVEPVFFSGSTNANDYEVFLQQIVTSQYWSALQAYGVGDGTTDAPITASTTWPTPEVTESQIEQTIISNDAWGAPITNSTVLVIFLPQGTAFSPSLADQTTACLLPSTDNCSIRGQVTVGGTPIQFIAMPPDTQNNGDIQYSTLLRRLIDAVTNPGGGAGDVANDQGYVEASENPDWYVGIDTYTPHNQLEVGNACLADAPVESDLSLTGDQGIVNGLTNLYLPYVNSAAKADASYTYCGRLPYGLVADWSTTPDAQTVTATRFGHPVSDEALVLAPGQSTTVKMTAWQISPTVASNGGQPYFTLPTNYNVQWYYLTGTNAPVFCQNGEPANPCANAPTFALTPVSTVTPVLAGTDPNGSNPQEGAITSVNGDTYNLTVTASSTAEPGMWVMYEGGQPIAVTNANTWQ